MHIMVNGRVNLWLLLGRLQLIRQNEGLLVNRQHVLMRLLKQCLNITSKRLYTIPMIDHLNSALQACFNLESINVYNACT